MARTIALIGFGEAAMAFAAGLSAPLLAYDIKTDIADFAAVKRAQYDALGVAGCDTAAQALQGAEAALSLVTADQALPAAEWSMTEEQKQAVLDRDYNRLLDLGGNIYFMAKVFSTDGQSFLQAVSTMSGMGLDDYAAMMLAGGRSPEGQRSTKEGR